MVGYTVGPLNDMANNFIDEMMELVDRLLRRYETEKARQTNQQSADHDASSANHTETPAHIPSKSRE